jgi:hypothetical protein
MVFGVNEMKVSPVWVPMDGRRDLVTNVNFWSQASNLTVNLHSSVVELYRSMTSPSVVMTVIY